jgi:Ca2+-binding RTX toxin-like protein
MAIETVLVTELSGRAWLRGTAGVLNELRVGMRIPVDADIVTAANSSLQLRVPGQSSLTIGENRSVALARELFADPGPENASVAQPGLESVDDLLAVINSEQDPFADIDPTAATLDGGTGGGGSFVRLLSILEQTSPLDLRYQSEPLVIAPLYQPDDTEYVEEDSGTGGDIDLSAFALEVADAGSLNEGDVAVFQVSLNQALDVDSTFSFTLSGNVPSAVLGDVTIDADPTALSADAQGVYSFTVPAGTLSWAVQVFTQDDAYYQLGADSLQLDGSLDAVIGTQLLQLSDSGSAELLDANQSPVLEESVAFGLEDGGAVTGNVLDRASDADSNQTLTVESFTLEQDATLYQAGSTVVLEGGELTVHSDGRYSFTPNRNWNGSVPLVSFMVSDGVESVSAGLSITIEPVNDQPLAQDAAVSLDRAGTHVFEVEEFGFSDPVEGHDLLAVQVESLPEYGVLTLDGVAVVAGQEISAADIEAGLLVYTADAQSPLEEVYFSYQVRDDGGVENGGLDTSSSYIFTLNTGVLILSDNADGELDGSAGHDVIVGDEGGVVQSIVPGKNYNIALIVDTSSSMSDDSGQSNLALTVSALQSLSESLIEHDGVINVVLISFDTNAERVVVIEDLDSNNVAELIAAFNELEASGGTNYESAFDVAVAWFDEMGSSQAELDADFENISYFLTDGNPSLSNEDLDENGEDEDKDNPLKYFARDSDQVDYGDLSDGYASYQELAAISEVHAIGIGDDVNSDVLKYFDNTSSIGSSSYEVPEDDAYKAMPGTSSAEVTFEGNAGEPEIVTTEAEFNLALESGTVESVLNDVGSDHIEAGDGDDIIFGDTLNTDGSVLDWDSVGGRPSDLADGSGVQALRTFLSLRDGREPSDQELYDYIKTHHADFDVAGDTRGGADTLLGGGGDDILYGQGGDDQLYGGTGDDRLLGGEGDDVLAGGAGDDTLTGGGGADTFVWAAGDAGTLAQPAVDVVSDFDSASDSLDLSGLLDGEDAGLGNLSNYLYLGVEDQGSQRNTVILVSSSGALEDDGSGYDQKIVLEGVDLVSGASDQNALISQLISDGKLKVDGS